MILFRRILFWSLTAVYLIVCPAVILYALGYFKSGLITIKILPENAFIRVAGQQIEGPWPVTVTGVRAGKYKAVIQAPGHTTQKRVIQVTRGGTTELKSLLLLPEPLVSKPITKQDFIRVYRMSGTPFLLLEREDGLSVYDWKQQTLNEVRFPTEVASGFKIRRIDLVDGSPFVFICVSHQATYSGVFLDINNAAKSARVHPMPRPAAVVWDAGKPENLYLIEKGVVRPLFTGGKTADPTENIQVEKNTDTGIRGFGLGEGKAYWLDGDGQVRREQIGADATVPQVPAESEPATIPMEKEIEKARALFGNTGFFRIFPREGETLFFIGGKGQFLQNELPYKLVEDGVVGIQNSGKKAPFLLWQRSRAGIVDEPEDPDAIGLSEGKLQPGRDVDWFYEQGNDIRAVELVYAESHALVLDGNQVFLCELFPGAIAKAHPVLEVRTPGSIAYVEEMGTLFFLDPKQGRLHSVRLIPDSSEPEAKNSKNTEVIHE